MSTIDFLAINSVHGVLSADLQINDVGTLYIENPLAAVCESMQTAGGAVTVSLNEGNALAPGFPAFQFALNGQATYVRLDTTDPAQPVFSSLAGTLTDVSNSMPADGTFRAFWDGLNSAVFKAALEKAMVTWTEDNAVGLSATTVILIISVATAPVGGSAFLMAAVAEGLTEQLAALVSGLLSDVIQEAAKEELSEESLSDGQAQEMIKWAKAGDLLVQLGAGGGEAWDTAVNDAAAVGTYVFDDNTLAKVSINYPKDLAGKFSMLLKIKRKI